MPTLLTRCRAAWSAFRLGTGDFAAATLSSPAAPAVVVPDTEIPRYPPFLQGLPVASTAQILATQSELIAGLQEALAMTDADYRTLVLPLIERYAAFAHLLPASETHHHRGAGGLFRHGLEVAFHCARASRGRLFAVDRLPQERRVLEPRWQLAAAVVGLLHDVGKPVADLLVLDRTGTSRWQPVDDSILDWATREGIDRYFLRWNGQRLHQGHEVFTTSVFPQLLSRELRRWLMDPDPLVWYSLGSVLAGRDDQALLARLMREADRISVAQDLRENRLDPEALSLGVPIERYLIDSMRALLRDGTWAVNSPGARVWIFPTGLHLVWPESAQDLVQRLAEARVPGIPRDPDTLADLLLERQLAIPCPMDDSERPARTWRLAPAILARTQPQWLTFLRLAEPELLFSGVIPTATALVGETVSLTVPDPSVSTVLITGEGREVPEPSGPSPQSDHQSSQGVTEEPTQSSAPEEARTWFGQHPPAGPALVALMERVGQWSHSAEATPRQVEGQLFLPYPQSFAAEPHAPSPEEVLTDLSVRDWITPDPRQPLLRVRAIAGIPGVLLTREISARLMTLVDPQTLPARPASTRRSGAADYARALEQRLLARDPELGPIQIHDNALSVALHGPVLDGAKASGIAEATLIRALRKRPHGQVAQGRFILGL